MDPYLIDLIRNHPTGNINLEKKILFIHVPKCAGNSIKKAVGGFKGNHHLKASDCPKFIFEKFFSFAFVRNPWDRCFSAYRYLLKGGDQGYMDLEDKEKYVNKYDSFYDFLKNGLAKAIIMQQHFKRQIHYIDKDLNFVGKFENINSDFSLLSNMIECDNNLTKENYNPNPDYRKFYNEESINIVYNFYKKDVEKFNYQF